MIRESKTLPRRLLRLKDYDYAQVGAYFVTICSANREFLFGEIIQGEMILNQAGRIVQEEWLKTTALRAYVKLDQFVVMPNHFHGILIISRDDEGTARCAPTERQFGKMAPDSLSSTIRGFKAGVSKSINLFRNTLGAPVWQRGFYEHVIRNDASLNRIQEYILTNPLRWELDRENPRRCGEDEFDHWLGQLKTRPNQPL
ncbi:MAG: hypothetical protein A2Y80_02600 [Deltaproteobacteria bacterium RBG_13_58_19]|nr:MAG: hypothetical protein A2Y80_02600 [Deltaproteobacteria bacterium RBG_13_58_19]